MTADQHDQHVFPDDMPPEAAAVAQQAADEMSQVLRNLKETHGQRHADLVASAFEVRQAVVGMSLVMGYVPEQHRAHAGDLFATIQDLMASILARVAEGIPDDEAAEAMKIVDALSAKRVETEAKLLQMLAQQLQPAEQQPATQEG